MALADYYDRGALAAAQVIAGFDDVEFRSRVEATRVAVVFTAAASRTAQGSCLLDLAVRLLARLYPSLAIAGGRGASVTSEHLQQLARDINPRIDVTGKLAGVDAAVIIGDLVPDVPIRAFAGAAGWTALLDPALPQPIGDSPNPFGPGAAAALAAGSIFRQLFANGIAERTALSTFDGRQGNAAEPVPTGRIGVPTALIGVGAVGNSAAWALGRSPLQGRIHLVDHEVVDLGNLQRYALGRRSDEGIQKVDLGAQAFGGDLTAVPTPLDWASFVAQEGAPERALVALDSAADRRAVQAALPRWIANAWTQPGDLGVSVHPTFGEDGACLACLYLPDRAVPNEDELVAAALRVPERVREVRALLHSGAEPSAELLEAVSQRLGLAPDSLDAFAARPLRSLYVEGICGGAVLPLSHASGAPAELHVPLAHQSALAGVLLAAALARSVLGDEPDLTNVTRLDVLRPVPTGPIAMPARRRADGRCYCDDSDYVTRYVAKWTPS